MRTTSDSKELREFLGKVRPHLPIRDSVDILRELESAVLDRVDDLADSYERPPQEADYRQAISEIGAPEAVAASYAPSRHLIDPGSYRTFLFHAGMVFVVHLILIGISTAISRPFHMGLFTVEPVGPHGVLSVLAAGVHAGLVDLGLVTAVYAVAGALHRRVVAGASSFAIDVAPRQAGGRLVLAILFALLLAVFRDDVFVVVSGGKTYPLFTTFAGEVISLVVLLLMLAAGKDLLYAIFGERRTTVLADALHGALGVTMMLYLLRGEALMQIPAIEGLEIFTEPVNAFLAQLGTLVLAAGALLMGAKTLRRCIRVAQL
jgi:hypothetical protein